MKYVTIPNTDLRVSQLCIGSAQFGAALTEQDAFALLDQFVKLGGNFIDTAHVYCNWIPGSRSSSEKMIGKWLTTRGNRNQLVIATKGAHPDLNTMHISRMSNPEIEQDISESLEYLQTDHIDLYWLHRDDVTIPVGQIINCLNAQVAAGKIRYFGASNWTTARLEEAYDYAQKNNVMGFVANQPLWSLAHSMMGNIPDQTLVALDEAGTDFHRRTGMAVIPYSAQGHGFFSKLATVGREGISKADLAQFDNDTNARRLPRIQELAQKYGVGINHIVLAYLYSQPFVTVPVIGPRHLDQLADSASHTDLLLTPDEVAYLQTA